ncbi:MAG TPA: AmmeMemoRadiSam system protein B [Chloroflexota bacterium]|nr:AmmeMemoRadiSam system protein B [Chloroflexota bacterium]
MTEKPKLRLLDYQPVYHMGQQMWYLHDPLQLTHYQLVMPPALAQMLLFVDGSRDAVEIHRALCQYLGVELELAVVHDALAQMDEACLLDNARSQQRLAAARDEYRAQPFRPPALAKNSYPEQPTRLSALFADYGRADNLNGWQPWHGRGLISPHIDYPRGGPVYAKVWQRARQAVLDADLVIIFGTDHKGGLGTFTLTRQHYATPYGVIPTDLDLVDRLAEAIGPEKAFAEELHHRNEHSIELSAVWLHHIYQQAGVTPKPMLPVLVGSFHHFMMNGHHPAKDDLLLTALETLKRETAGRQVLAIASVDFAHVGPAFGDEYVMDDGRRAALRQADDRLVQAIIRGDAAGFYEQITAVQDQNRICGFSPIYLLLQYLGSTEGIQVAYDHCPADEQNHSLVSIAGVLLE